MKQVRKKKIRKGAQMALLFNCHPDIEEFIKAKRVPNKLDKFNVSVACYNSFMDAVVRVEESGVDENLDLYFPDTTSAHYKEEWDGELEKWLKLDLPIIKYKQLSVKYLWELIMKSTYDFNDPGVLFIDRCNETYLANYLTDKHISKCNPCGEQTMPAASVCDLGTLCLPFFLAGSEFQYKELEEAVRIAVRFLDNVNDISKTPHKEYDQSAKEMRRIGLGIMGWGSLLYLTGIRYGSDKSSKLIDSIMSTIVYTAFETSADLAAEKGWFIGCDPITILENEYVKRINLPENIRQKILAHGLRNSALFSIQPNGNTSILCEVMSGGLEPVFLHEWVRTTIVQSPPDHIREVCPKYWEGDFVETSMFKFVKEGEETILRGTDNKGTVYKIDKNRGLTREVLCEDHAVSILKREGKWNPQADWAVTTADLKVEDHIKEMTGWCKWLDASCSKTVNIPNNYPYEDFKKIYLNAYKSGVIKGITTYREGTMTNVLAPVKKDNRRPKKLPCDIFYPSVKSKKFFVAVGLKEDRTPYEIFCGEDGFENKSNEGFIQRVVKGRYALISDNEIIVDSINELCSDEEEAIARMTSISLRNNVPLKDIINQLEKVRGSVNIFAKVMCRILRRYLDKGSIAEDNCPECGKNLIHAEGCLKCASCSFSRC